MSKVSIDWASAKLLRTFIGSKDFEQSRAFYQTLGFEEMVLGPKLSLFQVNDHFSFHLQDYYVKDWLENSMLFLVVEDLEFRLSQVEALQLPEKFPGTKVSRIKDEDWGRVFYIHDPSGVLWHVVAFR
ncbi:MAG: glyoxalase [Bacteroidota bacterium]